MRRMRSVHRGLPSSGTQDRLESDGEQSPKCDLCVDTPYWKEKGGPKGKQACVEACPMGALKFVAKTPEQVDSIGYDVNLRKD